MMKNKIVEATDKIVEVKDTVVKSVTKVKPVDIQMEDVLINSLKIPGVKLDRERFLRKELSVFYPENIVDIAIEHNPAYAGIKKDAIDSIAKKCISYETNKVSAISFAAGMPGGVAMAATIPADLAQYFGFILRIMQKLAYLYGFEDFDLDGEDVNDNTMNEILLFLGVMFGVQEANAGLKILASAASQNVSKRLAQKTLTKGTIYPIVKKVAKMLGVRMTKQVFANGVSKIVPVIGGVAAGSLTYATFKPCSYKLKKSLSEMPLCDTETYNDETISD